MSPKSLSADLSDDCESGLGLLFLTEAPTGPSGAFSHALLETIPDTWFLWDTWLLSHRGATCQQGMLAHALPYLAYGYIDGAVLDTSEQGQ